MTIRTDTPRGQHGKVIRTPAQIATDHEAAGLKNRGLSYRKIAAEMGWANPSTAFYAVQRAIADIPREETEELIARELLKLDYMEEQAAEIMHKHHCHISASGKVVTLDGEILTDDGPALQAMDRLLKIADRRAKLLGLNAPTRTELTGKDGGAIEIEDKSREAKASVLALFARLSDSG